MERKKLLIIICIFLGVLVTNFTSYVINNLEPNTFVKEHAILLLIILSGVMAIVTTIIADEGKVFLSIRGSFAISWGNIAIYFWKAILAIVFFAIFVVGPIFLYIYAHTPSPMIVDNASPEVQLVQQYCDAIKKQDYVRAYNYGDLSSIQQPNSGISRKDAYIEKARLADQAGRVKSCVVEKETRIGDDSFYSTTTNTDYINVDYVLDAKITREKQPSYFVHFTIHVFGLSPPSNLPPNLSPTAYITGIDRL